jgi:hypothetical protein
MKGPMEKNFDNMIDALELDAEDAPEGTKETLQAVYMAGASFVLNNMDEPVRILAMQLETAKFLSELKKMAEDIEHTPTSVKMEG